MMTGGVLKQGGEWRRERRAKYPRVREREKCERGGQRHCEIERARARNIPKRSSAVSSVLHIRINPSPLAVNRSTTRLALFLDFGGNLWDMFAVFCSDVSSRVAFSGKFVWRKQVLLPLIPTSCIASMGLCSVFRDDSPGRTRCVLGVPVSGFHIIISPSYAPVARRFMSG